MYFFSSCFPKAFKYDLDKCAIGPRYKLDRAAIAKLVHAMTPRLHQVRVSEPCCKLTHNNYQTCKVTPTFRWFVPAFIFYSRIVTFVSIRGDFFCMLWKYLLLPQRALMEAAVSVVVVAVLLVVAVVGGSFLLDHH